jgi:tetratricopeptide (TPR) repeat protein
MPTEPSNTEANRLRQKLATIDDPDIRKALELRIAELQNDEPHAEPATEPEPESERPLPPPPTPEQIEQAEILLRSARLERSRGNAQKATELLEQAANIAPGSVSVLTSIADDYIERRQIPKARELLAQAVKLDPTNVALERKYAELVLRTSNALSVEDALRAGLSDFGGRPEAVASARAATLLSVVLPGSGHFVLGYRTKGLAMLIVWVAMMAWAIFTPNGFGQIIRMANGLQSSIDPVIFVPLFVAAAIHISAVMGCAQMSKTSVVKKIDNPKPPVNLPY